MNSALQFIQSDRISNSPLTEVFDRYFDQIKIGTSVYLTI